ncbi:MAG TPA: tetratricopeptide repeat protein [Candidatus Hydrogenedentes bacterium]|jgi:Flp pilus assembly protein TadD|nr:tetratricopeptide repeat protein [Candidatus Hydrogenedentota bacterium]HQM99712.1 tetratricopeptide repeat protein [Candidatus Hydrogenedentota bacterium]
MAPLKTAVILYFVLLPLLAAAEPSTDVGHENQPGDVSRKSLLERLESMRNAGVTCMEPVEGADAYLEVLKSLGYHDLLAACLQERLDANYQGAAEQPELWRALGEAWMLSGPHGSEKAFEAFQSALTLRKDDAETQALIGHLLHREGLYEQASAAYDQALTFEPENIRARVGKAALLARNGDISEASAQIDALGSDAQPYDITTRLMLRKALYDFEKRRGWFEDTATNHTAYARLLYRAGRITDALVSARRAVGLSPEDVAVWNFIAAMHIQLGTLEQAKQAYENSLEAKPDQPQVEAALSQIRAQLSPPPQE